MPPSENQQRSACGSSAEPSSCRRAVRAAPLAASDQSTFHRGTAERSTGKLRLILAAMTIGQSAGSGSGFNGARARESHAHSSALLACGGTGGAWSGETRWSTTGAGSTLRSSASSKNQRSRGSPPSPKSFGIRYERLCVRHVVITTSSTACGSPSRPPASSRNVSGRSPGDRPAASLITSWSQSPSGSTVAPRRLHDGSVPVTKPNELPAIARPAANAIATAPPAATATTQATSQRANPSRLQPSSASQSNASPIAATTASGSNPSGRERPL